MEITFYRRIANSLADKVVESHQYTESEVKRIRYALVCFFSDFYKFILLLIIFSIFSLTVDFLVAYAAFMLIRPFVGGYHAKNEPLCILMSFLTMLISVTVGRMNLIPDFIHIALIVLLPVTGIIISPVRTKKIEEKTRSLKLIAFILTFAILVVDYYFLPNQVFLISIVLVYVLAVYQLSKNIYHQV